MQIAASPPAGNQKIDIFFSALEFRKILSSK
jgi:hypothetical protein